MLSTKQSKIALNILIPLFIAVLSICVFATKIPETKFVEDSIESLEKSKTTVIEFAGATMATSLAISALPDDFATPYANNLANMNKYFIIILVVLLIERLIVIEGIKISFVCIIPTACGLYILSGFIKKNIIREFAVKVFILGVAIVLVVPCSTHLTDFVSADYLTYVDETIEETSAGADKINEEMSTGDEDATIFEKLSEAFKTAIQGITDLLTYFNNVIKKCINAIAILIVTTVAMPVFTLLFFKWILNQLFHIKIPTSHLKNIVKKNNKDEKLIPSVEIEEEKE